jgi:hypothetical protein
MLFAQAMVYLHEIADARYKAVTGSLGYVSLGIGVVIGILAVVMVISLIPAGVLCNMLRGNVTIIIVTVLVDTCQRWQQCQLQGMAVVTAL